MEHILRLQPLLIIGAMLIGGFYIGRSMKFFKLPSIIGFMLLGVLLGPSLCNILYENLQTQLNFITDIALGFVAISIGIELSLSDLKKQGMGIIIVIFMESFFAFLLVATGVYLLTKDLPLSLIFGAIAPASAPAGTVAIIREYKAKGSLTKALYTVVGFDDGLGIIIFGFSFAMAKSLLSQEMGLHAFSTFDLILKPLTEILISCGAGVVIGLACCFFIRKINDKRDVFTLVFAGILISVGLCNVLNISIILTNMVAGIIIVNTQQSYLVRSIHNALSDFMPLLFILFFILAGANLHINVLPSLGSLGIVYILCRTGGLMSGAFLGAIIGKLETKIKKYLGMGILSQAGVAIGLSLIVKREFVNFGAHGMEIGSIVITTVTATCIFFEIIGPITTKMGLEKAGEIGRLNN
jgi:NhaP-type Na+/H+ or K+/H+ antiporter